MAIEMSGRVGQFVDAHRVARLATVDTNGDPAIVPVCYVRAGSVLYSPIDEKPKQVAPRRLKRIRNIEAHPAVALLIDDYSDDWTRLAYVLIRGSAAMLDPASMDAPEHAAAVKALRAKYRQYLTMTIETRPMIRIAATSVKAWSATQSLER
jgi:PPOX class probable F420-dependent enzyme